MAQKKVKAVFQGMMEQIRKSRHPLAPIYEAIANSLEAILQKQFTDSEKPLIQIKFEFTGLLEEKKYLDRIVIQDNGIGFDKANFARFETLLDKSKGYNNRGSGRIQFVHRFGRVEVISFYSEDNGYFKRTFSCSRTRFIYDERVEQDITHHKSGTILSLIADDALGRDKDFFDDITIDGLVSNLKTHLVLRFYLEKENANKKTPLVEIKFEKNGRVIGHAEIRREDMPQPVDTGSIKIFPVELRNPQSPDPEWKPVIGAEKELLWANFKLAEKELSKNAVWLCSKGVTVTRLNYDIVSRYESVKGFRYLTVFYGGLLDDEGNVSDSVDSFQFPDRKVIEEQIKEGDLYLSGEKFFFFDDIKRSIAEVIPKIFKDIVNIQQDQQIVLDRLAKQHGISLEIAKSVKLNLSDDEKTIIEKLYKEQAEYSARRNRKIRKVFDDLNHLDPTAENYQKQLSSKSVELLELIPEQNKEELGRYIIRREMVADILRRILRQELAYQQIKTKGGRRKSVEKLIHDLIFRQKSASTNQLNELWILNEEYVHFDGCSELPLNQLIDGHGKKILRDLSQEELKQFGVKLDRRPDIFLYPEEGKCVIIELKDPKVDLSDHLNQMIKYCNVLANYSVRKLQKFYCYLIGEDYNPITDLESEYSEAVNGDWVRGGIRIVSFVDRSPLALAQIEIVKLSTIYERAHRRNKSFASKLGLRDILVTEGKAGIEP